MEFKIDNSWSRPVKDNVKNFNDRIKLLDAAGARRNSRARRHPVAGQPGLGDPYGLKPARLGVGELYHSARTGRARRRRDFR